MNSHPFRYRNLNRHNRFLQFLITVSLGFLLVACTAEANRLSNNQGATADPSSSPDLVATSTLPHATNAVVATSSEFGDIPEEGTHSNPTDKPEPTQIFGTASPFNWEIFNPGDLWEDVEPVIYLQEACGYLQMRWDPEKSPPGTIVAPIMFHSVKKSGRPINDATSITEEYFHAVMAHARDLGYKTITSEELVAFLTENAKIPEKSMYMVLDDRRPGVTERFLPYLDYNDWTLTLGWIIEDQREYLWNQMEGMVASSGRLDVQSHGYWHRYIVEETPEEIIREEIFNPIPIIEEHFGTTPIIFIWPGGNFTTKSVDFAHEAGYQLAFTAFARGPIMFNWVPQAEDEKLVGDPLMTLPRFWSVTAWTDLDETIEVGQDALSHALERYPEEAAWYQANCGGELPRPLTATPTATD